MMTSKDLTTLNFLEFSSQGRRYVRAYKNEWISKKVTGKVKGVSRAKEQHHVGAIVDQYRVRLSPKFLEKFPEFAGKQWFYENNLLKDEEVFRRDHPEFIDPLPRNEEMGVDAGCGNKTPEEPPAETNGDTEDPSQDDSDSIEFPQPTSLSFLPAYCVMGMAQDQGYLDSLAEVFGEKFAQQWIRSVTYRLLDGGPAHCVSDWLADQYLGQKGCQLTGQRISELYAQCTQEKFDQFWLKRFQRSQNVRKSQKLGKVRYCAFDSTSIACYSSTIEDAAYGHAKQDEGIPQINLAVVMDQVTGEFLYAHLYEGSINDRATYTFLIEKMVQAGFPMDEIILVTDRGYPSNNALNQVLSECGHFLTGCPINKDSDLEKWAIAHAETMSMPTFFNLDIELSCHSTKEKWTVGKMTRTVYVHYYYDMQEASSARQDLSVKIHQALNALNKGEKISDALMKQVRPLIKKVPNPNSNPHKKAEMHWVIVDEEVKRSFKRAGFFVLKTDCIADAASALKLYRLRGTIEEGFDQLKNELNGRRLRVTERSYRGRVLEFLIATSLRCQILARKAAQENDLSKSGKPVKIPGDSIDKMFRQLDRFKIRRQQSNRRWQLDLLPAKVVSWLRVFFQVKAPPRTFW